MGKQSGAVWKMYLHSYRPAPAAPAAPAAHWSLRQVGERHLSPDVSRQSRAEPPRSHYSQSGYETVRGILAPSRASDGVRQREEILQAITRKSQEKKNEKKKSHIWQEHSVPLLLDSVRHISELETHKCPVNFALVQKQKLDMNHILKSALRQKGFKSFKTKD